MNDHRSDQEKEFVLTGAKTYLDVDDAMAQFRRTVQDNISTLLTKRLDQINHACETGWRTIDIRDYTSRKADCFLVGKQLAIESFGGLYFYLMICREKSTLGYSMIVDLYRQRTNLAIDLWRQHNTVAGTSYSTGNDLVFERPLSEHEIPDFLEQMDRTVDDFMTFIAGCGA